MSKVIQTKVEFEGRMQEELTVAEGEGLSPWPEDAPLSHVGRKVARLDGPERVSGRAVYTADVQLPGMLWGKVLRSPIHHGKIKRIDVRRAAEIPGVRAIITGKDVPKSRYGFDFAADRPGDKYILAKDRVRYRGDEVAAVAAVDEETAEKAI